MVVLSLAELFLALPASRAVPVRRQVFKLRPSRDAVIGVALSGIVDIATNRADVLAGALVIDEIVLVRPDGLRRMVEIHHAHGFQILYR
jgi:hypothetical protein